MGTEMKRITLTALLLALLLLLGSCGSRFERDAEGLGYTDGKTDVYYTALPSAFEAGRAGDAVGEYTDKKYDRTVTFYLIPELDGARFLTDDNGYVYCADPAVADAAKWQPSALLICEEDAISVEQARLTASEELAAFHSAWFLGEESELPLQKASYFRRLKMACAAYPNLYYCVNFYYYEDGSAYFYDTEAGRAVVCPEALVPLFYLT